MGTPEESSATRAAASARRGPGRTGVSARGALARCRITMSASTTANIASNTVHKGDVLATARVAGIQAVAQATSLLPMSPSVPVSSTFIDFTIGDTHIDVEACVEASGRAGVEMAALSAVTVAALTVYDMCKSVDRTMTIGDVCVWENPASDEGTRRREDSLAVGEENSEH